MEPDDATIPNLRRLFLRRLGRLIAIEARVLTVKERRLVEWAIYSTCCDCYALGLGDDAQHILAGRPAQHEG